MQNIFRKERTYGSLRDDEFRESITVIPKASWLLLLGGILAVAGVLIWALTGEMITTTVITGIYHPSSSEYGELICFPNISSGKQIFEGMDTDVYLPAYDYALYGNMVGEVTYVDSYVTSEEDMMKLLGDRTLVQLFSKNAPVVCVVCKLLEDPESSNGYWWSAEGGRELRINDGTVLTVYVTVNREKSSSYMLK